MDPVNRSRADADPWTGLSLSHCALQQLEWLRCAGVPEAELGHVVCRAPAFLCTSRASLDAKLAFLSSIGVEGGEAVRVVCRYPEVLLTSVDSMQNR